MHSEKEPAPSDYPHVTASGPRTGLRFSAVTFGGGGAGFVAWCVLDFVLVRFAPRHIHDLDALGFLFPVAVALASVAVLRHVDVGLRIALSLAAAVLASILVVLLVLFIGIPFHFFFGGRL